MLLFYNRSDLKILSFCVVFFDVDFYKNFIYFVAVLGNFGNFLLLFAFVVVAAGAMFVENAFSFYDVF